MSIHDRSAHQVDSWIHNACDEIRPWCPEGIPSNMGGWRSLMRDLKRDILQAEAEDITSLASHHPGLKHYQQVHWQCETQWTPNIFLHDQAIDATIARRISRLLSGGQGLRAGDPRAPVPVSRNNCCIFCLEQGIITVGTLAHVVFLCPAHANRRGEAYFHHHLTEQNPRIMCLHRSYWSWRDMRGIRSLLTNVLDERNAYLGRTQGLGARQLRSRVNEAWEALQDAGASQEGSATVHP
jgi:hypothetical protein